MEELEDEYAIGLDLGTTFSCIGVYRNGGVEIIPNRNGEKTTPSIVILTNDSNILVGEETIDYLVKNYDSCIYEVKRLIGRKYNDPELKKEIEKLPFTIVKSNNGDFPEVELKINGKLMKYSPVEISSFIIKKMVKNAENYLNKKVSKLVITVPAYFNDSQRKLTKQAAELLGLKVIRVINEPTAAALSYGFDKKQSSNEKILIFDLGGGTFDVSILDLSILSEEYEGKQQYKSFKVLGTSGDTQLGGEDFDNELVNFFLAKRKDDEKEIREDKQAIKRLKVSCENIKKILSRAERTILRITNFYNNQELCESITRKEFEEICEPLFKKLENSLDIALSNAHLTKENINQIVLVGGSTRIPKVKQIVENYFPGCKINDKINPDEAVAYGATIDAEKILHNKDNNITNFHLLDITPLSLGTNVLNKSQDPKIKEEGDLMSVIIKRGTPIPTFGERNYVNSIDNQTAMSIDVYEGEKKYVKYNHLLKKSDIEGLTKRPKGETSVVVTYEIDVNGILTIKAKEKSENNDGQKIELTIKNDEISFSPEEIKKMREKNKEIFEKMNNNELSNISDYSNLKETLKKYKDAFEKCTNTKKDEDDDEEDDRITYITNFNNTLEEFIDKFDKTFDNETCLEKLYLYVKELFLSYIETLKLGIDRGEQKNIIKNIKKYIEVFINKSSGYLSDLLEILNEITKNKKLKKYKKEFYNIVIFIMEKLNEYGKECIYSNKKFCKYHSLMYFEQSKSYYEQYLSTIDEALLEPKALESLKNQKTLCEQYLNDINNGAFVMCLQSFNGGRLFQEQIVSTGRGITNDLRKYALGNIQNRIEDCKIVLSNYERALSSIQTMNNITKNEAICIANIIKINSILGYFSIKYKYLLNLAKRCEFIIENLKIDKKEEWYTEFIKLYESLKKNNKNKTNEDSYNELLSRMKESHGQIFKEIDDKFNTNKDKINFIKYIIDKHPYKDYKESDRNFNKYNPELLSFLLEKYQPDNYTPSNDDESQLKYCIAHEISKKLSYLFTTIQ